MENGYDTIDNDSPFANSEAASLRLLVMSMLLVAPLRSEETPPTSTSFSICSNSAYLSLSFPPRPQNLQITELFTPALIHQSHPFNTISSA